MLKKKKNIVLKHTDICSLPVQLLIDFGQGKCGTSLPAFFTNFHSQFK